MIQLIISWLHVCGRDWCIPYPENLLAEAAPRPGRIFVPVGMWMPWMMQSFSPTGGTLLLTQVHTYPSQDESFSMPERYDHTMGHNKN
jgi:hypothetical protein